MQASPPDPWLEELLAGMTDERRLLFKARYEPLRRQKNVALILSLTLGPLGVDRFYVGDICLGVLKLLIFLLFLGAAIVDIPLLIHTILAGPSSITPLYISLSVLVVLSGTLSCAITFADFFLITPRADAVNKVTAEKVAASLAER